MAEKTAAMKREILISLVQRYGHMDPKILVAKAKERGIYHLAQDDKEIYTLIEKFAEYHNLPFGFMQPPKEVDHITNQIVTGEDNSHYEDPFFMSLLNERHIIVRRLIAIDKLIKTYKNE